MDKNQPQPGFNPNFPPPMAHPGPPPQHFVPQQMVPPIHVIRAPIFGPTSTRAHCPSCKEEVHTNVEKKASGKTHLIALGLCIFCCCLCIPCVYCSDSLRVTSHTCTKCNTYLGSYSSI